MKWTGGLTLEEISNRNIQRIINWHKWFAWYPVTIGITLSGCKIKVWWEYVECRAIRAYYGKYYGWDWKYRELK